jgi:hypothetical protein
MKFSKRSIAVAKNLVRSPSYCGTLGMYATRRSY